MWPEGYPRNIPGRMAKGFGFDAEPRYINYNERRKRIMLKSIAVAAVVAGTVVMSAGVSADEGATCVVDGGSTGWLFSSEAGTVTLAEVIVPDGWRASVSVTVENNVGDVDAPYHDATLSVGFASFAVERDGQGRMWSESVTVPAGSTPVVLSSSDGWSAAYTVTVSGCELVPMIETTPDTTDPEPVLSPGPTLTIPKPVEASSAPVTVAPLESLPVTGAGTWVIAAAGVGMVVAGFALVRRTN